MIALGSYLTAKIVGTMVQIAEGDGFRDAETAEIEIPKASRHHPPQPTTDNGGAS